MGTLNLIGQSFVGKAASPFILRDNGWIIHSMRWLIKKGPRSFGRYRLRSHTLTFPCDELQVPPCLSCPPLAFFCFSWEKGPSHISRAFALNVWPTVQLQEVNDQWLFHVKKKKSSFGERLNGCNVAKLQTSLLLILSQICTHTHFTFRGALLCPKTSWLLNCKIWKQARTQHSLALVMIKWFIIYDCRHS